MVTDSADERVRPGHTWEGGLVAAGLLVFAVGLIVPAPLARVGANAVGGDLGATLVDAAHWIRWLMLVGGVMAVAGWWVRRRL